MDKIERAVQLMAALDPRATLVIRRNGALWWADAAINHDWLMARLGSGSGRSVAEAIGLLVRDLEASVKLRLLELQRAEAGEEAAELERACA